MQKENESVLQNANAVNTSILFSRFKTDRGLLTKEIGLNEDETISKKAAVYLSDGKVDVVSVDSISEFAATLVGLDKDEALAYGVPKRGGGRIMSEKRWQTAGRPPNVQQRCRADFEWPNGAGVWMLDYDAPGDAEPLCRDALLAALYGVCPEMQSASHLWWTSSSSLIFNRDTGDQVSGVRGQRVYFVVRDAADIARAGKVLVDRLWLSGFGHIQISSAGSLLERTLVDASVFEQERLDFAAGAACVPPLEQRRGAPQILCEGPFLDSLTCILKLTEAEAKEVEKIKRGLKNAAKSKADQIKAFWVENNASALEAKQGIPNDMARTIVHDAIERQRLRGDFVLTTEDGKEVSVAALLKQRAKWHATRFRHPIEADYPDHRIAYANLDAGGHPYLFCHAAGGVKFTLHSMLTTVQIQGGAAPEAVEKIIAAMVESRQFYLRGADLVMVGSTGDVAPISHHALKNAVEGIVAFEKWNMQQRDEATNSKGKYVPCDMPDDLAQRVKASVPFGVLPKLIGVQKHPLVTPEGRIVDEPGFDAATGLMLFEDPLKPFPRVRRFPTQDEVHHAVRTLWAPFSLFPFAEDVDRGVMLSAILTAAVRRALPLAPGFLFAAPLAGSGKTLLAECLAEIAGGGSAQSLPSNEDEIRKGLIATLRAAKPVMFFDNLSGSPESDALCALFTSEHYEGRVLGVSEMSGALPTRCLVLFSGNNLIAGGDLFRRVLRCYIDPKSSEPHSRQFDVDPLAYVREHRSEIIDATMTVLSGWVSTDAFRKARGRIGSFSAWDKLIGQCVVWIDLEGVKPFPESTTDTDIASDEKTEATACVAAATCFGDPKIAISEAHAADPYASEFLSLVTYWAEGDDEEGLRSAVSHEVSMGKVFEELERIRAGGVARDEIAGAVANAFHRVGAFAKGPNGLGKWLARHENRVANGYTLKARSVHGSKQWRVERAADGT